MTTAFCPLCRAEYLVDGGPRLQRLTMGEYNVARLVSEGGRPTEVAAVAGVSYRTVKSYLHSVYKKLGIPTHSNVLPHVRLAILWSMPLYQEGLRALNLLPEGVM